MSKITKDTEQIIISLYTSPAKDGYWNGVHFIAKQLNISPTSVHNVLKRNNIKTRNAKEAHAFGKRCKPVKNVPNPDSNIPLCKCGCGNNVSWNQRKNKWNVYVDGHYRKNFLYKDREWLYEQYINNFRVAGDIASDFGVSTHTIFKFLRKYNIPIRKQSESLSFSGALRGSRNAAWKGGVAKWDYSTDWKSICKQIKTRDNWTCQNCKEQRKRWGVYLHVHHKDGNKLNNSFDNLISLCAKCHRIIHAQK